MTVAEIVGVDPAGRRGREVVRVGRSIWPNRASVDMPIVEHVAYVVRGEMTPLDMLRSLVSRTAKPERHGH